VEPLCTFEDLIEVKLLRTCFGDGRVCAVIDHLARTHGSSRLGIVDTHTLTSTDDVACADAVAAHGVDGQLTDLVAGQFGDEVSLMAVVGEADGYVGLPTAGDDTEVVALNESVISFG